MVNVWFQNKRRSMKKKSVAWNRATALMSENAFGLGKSRFSTLAHPSKQKSLIRRDSSISLDSIATSREKKEALTYPRPPFTPRKNTLTHMATFIQRMQSSSADDDKPYLWDLLPSSPQLPPSSPTKETDLLSALPPQSRTMKSLEWACAKDRVGRRKKARRVLREVEEEEESPDVPELMLDSPGGDDTDLDDDMITPDNSVSMTYSPGRPRTNSLDSTKSRTSEDTLDEDVEAAIALLKFKVRNS